MIMTPSFLVDYLLQYQDSLIQIDLIKELFMIPDRMTASRQTDNKGQTGFVIRSFSPIYKGKLFLDEADPTMFYAVKAWNRIYTPGVDEKVYTVHEWTATHIPHDPTRNLPLCRPQDSFILHDQDIANYQGDSVDTTIGIFMANYLFLVYPFHDVIPYLNEEFTASKLEKRISLALLQDTITVAQIKDRYVNALSLFGGSPEIIAPNISEKTVTIPQFITDLREKLITDHREALEAGDASVMSDIEQQLIKAYRTYLEGDSSLHFLLKKKYFDVTLKKLFLTQGMVEKFGSPGKFTFVANPMGNGWKQKDCPTIFNEVRQGSYARAIETADGGVIAKLILRVLQDTRIDQPDCHTARGERIHGTKEILKDFLWNYVINPDGSNTCITDDTMDQFLNKDLVVRTPGYCQASSGFCAKCFGYLYEQIGQKAFAPVANDFARQITTLSLKSMHGKKHDVTNISNIDKYLVF
jgi:hypothetical protein